MIIEARDLTYKYGDLLAVDHISFSVEKGEILGFLGPNGAGKSTTVKMLTGQLDSLEGTAIVFGKDVSTHAKQVHERIGVCFEEKNLYPRMTVRENLSFFAALFDRAVDIDSLLEKVNLEKWADDHAETLSKGMQQRLMFARSLINDPDVLFLDEPTSGLDPISADQIRRMILEEKKKGKTIFLTTHNMMEADALSDRVGFINEGRIVALDTPQNLKLQYGVRSLKVKQRSGEGFTEETLPLDKNSTPQRMQELLERGDVATIHTQEASLEEVFIKLTGRKLVQ
jgi:ABC-2 type transport system ATP-binding protein